ncbi:MAG: hypothetical protein ICV64_02300 [Thermoleophilia bacterium]|nr:hypothetical protein [Thermoleophilia bacterium]
MPGAGGSDRAPEPAGRRRDGRPESRAAAPDAVAPAAPDEGRRTLALYLAAAVVYITLGVFVPEVLFSSLVGIAYLLLAVWVVPALVARVR